jgi:hypothetical protein
MLFRNALWTIVFIASNINCEAFQRRLYKINYGYVQAYDFGAFGIIFVASHVGVRNDIMCRKGGVGLLNKRTDLTYEA